MRAAQAVRRGDSCGWRTGRRSAPVRFGQRMADTTCSEADARTTAAARALRPLRRQVPGDAGRRGRHPVLPDLLTCVRAALSGAALLDPAWPVLPTCRSGGAAIGTPLADRASTRFGPHGGSVAATEAMFALYQHLCQVSRYSESGNEYRRTGRQKSARPPVSARAGHRLGAALVGLHQNDLLPAGPVPTPGPRGRTAG